MQLDKFIFSVCNDLYLELPVDVRLKTTENNIAAEYVPVFGETESEIKKHKITVWMGGENDRDLFTLIAHELIHAYQAENQFLDTHGRSFKLMARYLGLLYDLPDIYRADLDCE